MSNPTAVTTETTEKMIIQQAVDKLSKDRASAQGKSQFEKAVLEYLLKRVEESEALAQDVMQEHKTWQKCKDYINGLARKQAVGNCAVIEDTTVYEWAEDYYHKDDKAEEKAQAERAAKLEKAKKDAANKKNKTQLTSQQAGTYTKPVAEVKNEKTEQKKPDDGQMDIFSLLGM